MARPRTKPALCASGRHRPDIHRTCDDDGVTRTHCLDCRCQLVRTLASRAWYRSGMFF
ncbi:hypothetical protein KFK14_23910 [Sphingobium phenoxybenzoativorans]|uniref:Uncharacterized protein n=1 Tax=Sphingobium phenoxybenzoativorans TaxID=1592790 RepID=A0A975Q1Z3_9SPHN|nr:hypothetical protein [Sphingobium phenoxybenzoativorans]QUT05937.1 hypothetical protein KFK14_23910 [Sphingobium phenoxybenzoativorans]